MVGRFCAEIADEKYLKLWLAENKPCFLVERGPLCGYLHRFQAYFTGHISNMNGIDGTEASADPQLCWYVLG